MSTRNFFSAGDNSLFSHNETEQLRSEGWFIFEHNFEPCDVKRSKARPLFRSQAHPILFGGDEYFGAVLVTKIEELVEVGVGVGVVITECRCCSDVDAVTAQCGEELIRAGDGAKGDGSLQLRNCEAAMLNPYGRGGDAALQLCFEVPVFFAKDEDRSAFQGGERLAEASGG